MKKKIVQQINTILKQLVMLIDKGDIEDVVSCREVLAVVEKKCKIEAEWDKLSCYFTEIKQLMEKKESVDKIHEVVQALQSALEQMAVHEALFLPYQASMWDSLETVYQAVSEDDKWKAIVMPIPYRNINSKRETISIEYEGNLFPKDVVITHYLDYDLEEEKPDVIFIHNPYDQCNTVTEVFPEYFSSHLKDICEHLVYIPYYVVEKEMGMNQCYMPGPRNAWRVIAQNEACRKQFIKIGGLEENRVLVLGSPKFDKVNNSKESLDIPFEWKEKIGDRKVVFLNTHLSKVLTATERSLKQIRDIIEVFKERNNEVLLWRPHPLSIQTAKSMNPMILEEYLSLVDEFKGFNLGIYDDTSDLNRAIILADAYIGDRKSSVDQLFEETGKPMYFLDGNADEIKDETRYLRSLAGECIDNKLYCSNFDSNLFTTVDLDNGNIGVWKDTSNDLKCIPALFNRSVEYQDNIYFLPAGANDYVAKYAPLVKEMEYIELEHSIRDYQPIIEQDKLYLFPVYYVGEFPCIGLKTNQMEYIQIKYLDEICQHINANSLNLFPCFSGVARKGDYIYRVSRFASIIQKYDLKKNRFDYLELTESDKKLQTILATEDNVYILPQKYNGLYVWDEKKNRIKKYIDLSEYIQDEDMYYTDMIEWQEYIVLIGGNSTLVVFVHKQNESVVVIDCTKVEGFRPIKNLINLSVNMSFSNAVKQTKNQEIVFIPNAANGIIIIDKDLSPRFVSAELSKEKLYNLATEQIVVNDALCTLDEFLNALKNHSSRREERMLSVGATIWNNVKLSLQKDIL